MEKSKVQQAIEARNKKRAGVQAVADSRKADAMTKRRGYASKGKTTMGAGTGMGIMKYAEPKPVVSAAKATGGSRTDSAGMQFFAKQVAKTMNSPKAAVAPKGPTTAQKRAASTAAPSVSKVTNVKPTGVGVAGLAAKPKAMNVTPGRTYTDKEKQVNALLMTGKKKDGTMKASAQRKIQNIRKK